jgi:hypothetical protein
MPKKKLITKGFWTVFGRPPFGKIRSKKRLLAAMAADPWAYKYASARLRSDPDIAREAVSRAGFLINYCPEAIRSGLERADLLNIEWG